MPPFDPILIETIPYYQA